MYNAFERSDFMDSSPNQKEVDFLRPVTVFSEGGRKQSELIPA